MDSILTFPPRFSESRYHAELYIAYLVILLTNGNYRGAQIRFRTFQRDLYKATVEIISMLRTQLLLQGKLNYSKYQL